MTTFELSDQLIERALRSRATAGADELLVQSILREVGVVSQVRRPWLAPGLGLRRTRWVIAAAATLVVVLAALIVLGGGHAPVSLPPSFAPSPAATATGPSPAATAVATGRLVFIRDGDVVLLDLGSGSEQVIVHVDGAFDPHWTPDGTAVAFRAGGGSIVGPDAGQAIRINIDGSGRLTRPVGTHVLHDSWSPDTTRLAEDVSGTAPADVAIEEVLVNRFTLLRFFDPGQGFGEGSSTSWSPDGRWLAAVGCFPVAACAGTSAPATKSLLWSVATNGSGPRAIATTSKTLTIAGWKPDSSYVAYAESNCAPYTGCVPQTFTVMEKPATGGSPGRLLGAETTVSKVTWAPDGSVLAYSSRRDGSPRIYISAEDGSGARAIAAGLDPIFSPDGAWLAFTGTDAGHSLWIAPVDGSSPPEQVSPASNGVDWWQPGSGTP